MGFFRWRKGAVAHPTPALEPLEPSEPAQGWFSRINIFRKNSGHSESQTSSYLKPLHIPETGRFEPLPRADTSSSFSQLSSLTRNSSGRTTLYNGGISPVSSASSPVLPSRAPSVYSHRSYSIRRNSMRPVIPRSSPSQDDVPPLPTREYNEDGLVLTATSQYPTGIAAELYVPEDLSYKLQKEREKEFNREDFRNELRRRSSLARAATGLQTAQEKQKLKRLSINF